MPILGGFMGGGILFKEFQFGEARPVESARRYGHHLIMLARTLSTLAALTAATTVCADVALPAVFSHHMVLQRDMPIRVFGQAQPNEGVSVALKDSKGQTIRTAKCVGGPDGRFTAMMDALPATIAPLTLVVEGANTVTVNDVLVGEVWLAGGQSNMEWPIGATGAQADQARAAADDPLVRLLKAPHVTANRPMQTINASWVVQNSSTVNDFSAVAYWFAKDLRQSLGVPVGILSINWGGTRAEPWVDLATLGSDVRFQDVVAAQRQSVEQWMNTPEALREHDWQGKWSAYQSQINAWWATVNGADPGAMGRWFAPETEVPAAAEGTQPIAADAWTSAALPSKWSTVDSLLGWDGSVWYRRTVEIPDAWAGKECVAEFGPIDDCDVLYFNGRAVANTVGEWSAQRRYRIPADLVKAGSATIVLQVLDLHGEGGVTSGPMKLVCPKAENAEISLEGVWLARRGGAAANIAAPPARPVRDAPPASLNTDPGALYHAMIAPFAGYAIRGAIWYQGESNAGSAEEAAEYKNLLPLVVRSWRAAFGRPDMPFGVVSLAAFRAFEPNKPASGIWPILRDSQLAAESAVPNVGVITTTDVGDAADIHPRDKRTVGERLAHWARSSAYGQRQVAWRGPRVARSRLDGHAVVLEFDVERAPLSGGGEEKVLGFALAGEDGVFHWADAVMISPTAVRVTCEKVPLPVEVRYAWQDNPQNANLVDNGGQDGLPAHPFRRVVTY